MFDSINYDAPVIKVSGVVGDDSNMAKSHGVGDCTIMILVPDGDVRIKLTNCLYVPDMHDNVFNVWYSSLTHGTTATFTSDRAYLMLNGDTRIPIVGNRNVSVTTGRTRNGPDDPTLTAAPLPTAARRAPPPPTRGAH